MSSTVPSAVTHLNCTANDITTGLPCPCREYHEAKNPDTNKPICCLECLHGQSVHQAPAQMADLITVDPAPAILVGTAEPQTHSDTGSGPSVNAILRGLLQVKTPAVKMAHKETNSGLQKAQLSTILSHSGKDQIKMKGKVCQEFCFRKWMKLTSVPSRGRGNGMTMLISSRLPRFL